MPNILTKIRGILTWGLYALVAAVHCNLFPA